MNEGHAVYFYFLPISFCYNNCGALYLIMVGMSYNFYTYVLRFCQCLSSSFYDDASKVTNLFF